MTYRTYCSYHTYLFQKKKKWPVKFIIKKGNCQKIIFLSKNFNNRKVNYRKLFEI